MANLKDTRTQQGIDERLRTWGKQFLTRRAAVGLAVGAIRGTDVGFHAVGWSDIASRTPITEHSIFRIGSISKTMTAVAVMQLWEDGLLDLDSPAEDHLSAYRLVPSESGWGPVTIGHLLTHTSGIPDVLRWDTCFTLHGDPSKESLKNFGKRTVGLFVAAHADTRRRVYRVGLG